MKNTLLILAAGLLLNFSVEAQKKKSTATPKVDVPESVDASFKNQYASVDTKNWSKTYNGNFVAEFTNEASQKQSTEYNKAGVLLKTKTTVDVATLPEQITNALKTQYADAQVSEVVKTEIPGVAPFYKVKLTLADSKQKDILVSEEGTITE
jgi:Tfp pilus tip-associated adhesin PilY1